MTTPQPAGGVIQTQGLPNELFMITHGKYAVFYQKLGQVEQAEDFRSVEFQTFSESDARRELATLAYTRADIEAAFAWAYTHFHDHDMPQR